MDIINLSRQGLPPEEGDLVRVVHDNGATEEKEWHYVPEIPDTFLEISLPEEGTLGVPFNIEVKVTFADGTLAPTFATYFVPIIRGSDSVTTSYHKVTFTDGQATLTVTPTYCGKLTMRLDLIEPLPTAKLPSPPFIHILSE